MAASPLVLQRRLRIAVWVGVALFVAFALYVVVEARGVLAPFFVAVLLAYLLEPGVTWLERRGLPRSWAIMVLYFAAAAAIVLGFWFVLPALAVEFGRLGEQLPALANQLQGWLDGIYTTSNRAFGPLGLAGWVDQLLARLDHGVEAQMRSLSDWVVLLPNLLFTLLAAPLIGFYLLKDSHRIKQRAALLLPGRTRWKWLDLARRLDRVLGGFIRGQVLVALWVAGMVGLAMWLLGLKYAVLLGVFAGLADIIPYFGPVIGGIPAVLMGLLVSPLKGAQVVVALGIIQQLENGVVAPKIVGERVGLHPLAIILAILLGGHWGGLLGLLLAVPVTAALRIIVGFAWRELVDWRERWPA